MSISAMEVSATIGSSQPKLGRLDLSYRDVRFCKFRGDRRFSTCFGSNSRLKKAGIRLCFTFKALQSEVVREERQFASGRRSKSGNGVRLFVGLPLDAVSPDCKTINNARAIAAGMKALKLLGIEGVELPVWWGIVEKDAMGKYDWYGYLAVADMVQKMGLKLHVSICFMVLKGHISHYPSGYPILVNLSPVFSSHICLDNTIKNASLQGLMIFLFLGGKLQCKSIEVSVKALSLHSLSSRALQ